MARSKRKEYQKKYYQEHKDTMIAAAEKYKKDNRDKVNAKQRQRYHANKEENAAYRKERRDDRPWAHRHYLAVERCTNPKCASWKYYGAKGIKMEITIDEFEILWIRDNADSMKRPSISRSDHNKNYTVENCCFKEFSEHAREDLNNRYAAKRRELEELDARLVTEMDTEEIETEAQQIFSDFDLSRGEA